MRRLMKNRTYGVRDGVTKRQADFMFRELRKIAERKGFTHLVSRPRIFSDSVTNELNICASFLFPSMNNGELNFCTHTSWRQSTWLGRRIPPDDSSIRNPQVFSISSNSILFHQPLHQCRKEFLQRNNPTADLPGNPIGSSSNRLFHTRM